MSAILDAIVELEMLADSATDYQEAERIMRIVDELERYELNSRQRRIDREDGARCMWMWGGALLLVAFFTWWAKG